MGVWQVLQPGSHGAEVGNWQRFLNEQECVDWNARAIQVDEAFGPKSAYATKQWQTRNQLQPTGFVDVADRVRAKEVAEETNEIGFIPFIQAKNCKILHPNVRGVTVITIHTMESAEKPGTAENVARWFAGPTSPMASAHFCIDPTNIIQCVRVSDVAYHAPGVNNNGVGFELAGRARQTPIEWADEDSLKILMKAARLSARIAKQYSIPVIKLTSESLKNGGSGFCGHDDATKAFPGPGRTHWDPGPGMPWAWFLDLVLQFKEG
jgi:N-acetyl-anhydromuramyl-L-alanine amidase AmpD